MGEIAIIVISVKNRTIIAGVVVGIALLGIIISYIAMRFRSQMEIIENMHGEPTVPIDPPPNP